MILEISGKLKRNTETAPKIRYGAKGISVFILYFLDTSISIIPIIAPVQKAMTMASNA